MLDEAAIMAVLDEVMDPEIPVVSITDLGIVRSFADDPPRVRVTPTYTGCPATIAIEHLIRDALDKAGFDFVHLERVLFPPWTTEWISERGRRAAPRLRDRAAYRVSDGAMSAVRFQRYRRSQPVRINAMQGAVAVQQLPGAVRPLQVPLGQ